MDKLFARIHVIFTTAVTWLTLIAVVLAVVGQQLPGAAGPITTVVGWLTSAVLTIRRVTPVIDKAQRGILPQLPGGDL